MSNNLVKPVYNPDLLLNRDGRPLRCMSYHLTTPADSIITGLITNLGHVNHCYGIDQSGHLLNLKTGESSDLGAPIANGFIIDDKFILIRLNNDRVKLISISAIDDCRTDQMIDDVKLLSVSSYYDGDGDGDDYDNYVHQFYGLIGRNQWVEFKINRKSNALYQDRIQVDYQDSIGIDPKDILCYDRIVMVSGDIILSRSESGAYQVWHMVIIGRKDGLMLTSSDEVTDFDGTIDDIVRVGDCVVAKSGRKLFDIGDGRQVYRYCSIIFNYIGDFDVELIRLLGDNCLESKGLHAIDKAGNWYRINDYTLEYLPEFKSLKVPEFKSDN